MFRDPTGGTEAEQRLRHSCPPKHRSIAFLELITSAALAVSTAIAVTAVSIGIARADAMHAVASTDGASFAIALFAAMLLLIMGGFAVMTGSNAQRN